MSAAGAQTESVENRGNPEIRLHSCEFSDQLPHVIRCSVTVVSQLIREELECRVVTTMPMQHHRDLLAILLHDDLVQQCSHDALLQLWRAVGMSPESREIIPQPQQRRARGLIQLSGGGGAQRLELLLDGVVAPE